MLRQVVLFSRVNCNIDVSSMSLGETKCWESAIHCELHGKEMEDKQEDREGRWRELVGGWVGKTRIICVV